MESIYTLGPQALARERQRVQQDLFSRIPREIRKFFISLPEPLSLSNVDLPKEPVEFTAVTLTDGRRLATLFFAVDEQKVHIDGIQIGYDGLSSAQFWSNDHIIISVYNQLME
jgi:hypothetical protein